MGQLLSNQPKKNGNIGPPEATRVKLPRDRKAITHKFNVNGYDGYVTVGLYQNGQPGEIFITIAKNGSTISGVLGSLAMVVSMGLQHGVPLSCFCDKFSYTHFAPCGPTENELIPEATSIVDYIFRWLQQTFIPEHKLQVPDMVSEL